VPWDLGALLALQQLRAGGAPEGAVRVDGFVGASAGGVSGGTLASMRNALEDPAMAKLGGSHALDPEWAPRTDAGPQLAPRHNAAARRWTLPSIMAAVNEKVVHRSAALAPQLYGARGAFQYAEATLAPNALGAALGAVLMGAGALALALPPTRWLLFRTVLPAPGQGPAPATRESGFFSAHFVACDSARPPRRAYARVAVKGADPGYKGTAMMATEAALCLALQREALPGRAGGVLTPATCMGDTLAARLRARGFELSARDFGADERVPDE
jgi:short subunit dehydrogenase-like uncharacterized protein